MDLSDNTPSFRECVDRSAAPEPVSRLREAQDELEIANRALKEARSTQAAAAKAASAVERRVKDCQARIYELS